MAVQAGGGKGKVMKLDTTANVVVLEDGSMYRVAPDTVFIVEEKPVKFDALQPGTTVFGHWLEYNGEAADNATRRLHQFLDRHLN